MPLCIKLYHQQKGMGLNGFINERVGLGAYQIHCFFILCLIDLNDGVQLVLSSFMNPIIKVVFPDVTSSFIELMASIFYVGILIGSLTSGLLADKYGRKRLITYGSILQLIVSLLFYLATTLQIMLFLRFLYGFSFGFTVAITTSMFAQISPSMYRGKGILLINFCISIGKIYAVFLGYLFIKEQLKLTNWKLMMVCGSLPNIVVFLGSIFILQESPKFLMANNRIDEGITVISHMLKRNGKQPLTEAEESNLRCESNQNFALEVGEKKSYFFAALFKPKYVNKAIALSLCWIIINFCFYGQLVIEAFHITGKSSGINLSKYFLTVFGQIPSLLVAFYMIDHPNFGRKKSLMLFFIGGCITHLCFSAFQAAFIGSIARFFMKSVFQILYPLTTQSFDTQLRTKGFGFCSGSGRIGSIIMPFVIIPLDQWKRGSVYVLFAFLSLIASFVSWKMIEQTMQKSRQQPNQPQGQELKQMISNKKIEW